MKNGPIDCTNQLSDFLCRPGERMNHTAIPTDSFASILPKALVTQDFDKVRVRCPRVKKKREIILLCQAKLRTYCVFVSQMNINGVSDRLTEVFPLGFWVGKVRPVVVLPSRRSGLEFGNKSEGRTEAAFSYGDYATFASKVFLYQGIESIEVGTWSTLELVELDGPCWMTSNSCIEICGTHDHSRSEKSLKQSTNCVFGQAREPPSIRGGCHQ